MIRMVEELKIVFGELFSFFCYYERYVVNVLISDWIWGWFEKELQKRVIAGIIRITFHLPVNLDFYIFFYCLTIFYLIEIPQMGQIKIIPQILYIP